MQEEDAAVMISSKAKELSELPESVVFETL
jgi:hypothetical protein